MDWPYAARLHGAPLGAGIACRALLCGCGVGRRMDARSRGACYASLGAIGCGTALLTRPLALATRVRA
eukprot:11729594-Alexandrium_andersonii.AAC.1